MIVKINYFEKRLKRLEATAIQTGLLRSVERNLKPVHVGVQYADETQVEISSTGIQKYSKRVSISSAVMLRKTDIGESAVKMKVSRLQSTSGRRRVRRFVQSATL